MKCVAVCKDPLVAKALHRALSPSLDLEFFLTDRNGRPQTARCRSARTCGPDPRRVDSYVKANVTAATIVIIEDNGKRGLRRILRAVIDAGATHGLRAVGRRAGRVGTRRRLEERVSRGHRPEPWRSAAGVAPHGVWAGPSHAPGSSSISDSSPTRTACSSCCTTTPDPDAMASGLALRNLLHRTKTTAIIGAFQGVTRPENLRMANLLDISVEPVTAESLTHFDRIATVDVQPHYYGGLLTARRPSGRPPSGTDGIHDNVQRHSGRLRIDVDDLDRASAGRRCQHLRTHRDGNVVCDQGRTRSSSVGRRIEWTLEAFTFLLPAGRCSARAQDGGFRDHTRAASLRHPRWTSRPDARAGLHGTSWRGATRGPHPLRRRLPPPVGGRQVVDRVGCGERCRDRLGPQPGLLAQRRRLCQGVVRGHRQTPVGTGQWPRRSCHRRRFARNSAAWTTSTSRACSATSRISSSWNHPGESQRREATPTGRSGQRSTTSRSASRPPVTRRT